MKSHILSIALAAAALLSAPLCLAQEPQEPDIDKIITAQLDNLTKTFDLDEVQVFFVDSILQANYHAMMDENQRVQKTGATNSDTYMAIADKWMDINDKALERVFTKEQWAKYMKSGYGKEKKRRDKRIAERGY